MVELKLKIYQEKEQDQWDHFVLNEADNGSFLQTRRFLAYHGQRYTDHSLILYKGMNTYVAVIPACVIHEGNQKVIHAHKGSTFGGIVINKQYNNIGYIGKIMELLDSYLRKEQFDKVVLRFPSRIYCSNSTELISYYLGSYGYMNYVELSSYIDLKNYNDDILSNFSPAKRRDYRYAQRESLYFQKITSEEEVKVFYHILYLSLERHSTRPVHSLEELFDLWKNRLSQEIDFYGVYHEGRMVSGSMVFKFNQQVFHTQYLASNPDLLDLYGMNFLLSNLIEVAHKDNFDYFSMGISTEDQGKLLNKNLAQFKEGYGVQYLLNTTFYKEIKRDKGDQNEP